MAQVMEQAPMSLGALDALGFGELDQPVVDLLVGGDDVAQIAAEQILVEIMT